MKRIGVLLSLVASSGLVAVAAESPSTRPNIIVILADDKC